MYNWACTVIGFDRATPRAAETVGLTSSAFLGAGLAPFFFF